MQQQEELQENARENYKDLQQEVDVKTRKLKKLYNKLQSTKGMSDYKKRVIDHIYILPLGEIEDINEEHRNRMRELEQTLDALTRETKFYYIIMDNFIQPEEYRKLENRAEFDDEREVWQFKPIAEAAGIKAMMKRPERWGRFRITKTKNSISAAGNKRPVSRYAMVKAAETENPRYKCENVLQLELGNALQ